MILETIQSPFLNYFSEKNNKVPIGRLKIIKKNDFNTKYIIPHSFTALDDFCSIGEDISYYENLKKSLVTSFTQN